MNPELVDSLTPISENGAGVDSHCVPYHPAMIIGTSHQANSLMAGLTLLNR